MGKKALPSLVKLFYVSARRDAGKWSFMLYAGRRAVPLLSPHRPKGGVANCPMVV